MINYLKFPVSASILSAYNTPHSQELFDTSDNTFLFYVAPEDRSSLDEALGEDGINRGISLSVVLDPSIQKGAEFTTRDEREVTARVLNQLRIEAMASSSKTITVHDYVTPDVGDTFTVREMVMRSPVTLNGGTWVDGDGNRWYSGGFTIELIDILVG